MRIADYPFNKDLLVGRTVLWIPEEGCPGWQEYRDGARFEYMITGFDERYDGVLLVNLKSIVTLKSKGKGVDEYIFYAGYNHPEMLEIIDWE